MENLTDKTAHVPTTDPLRNTHRILLVDDDPAILFAYAKLLEREGLCVDSCECLLEAIKHIRSHSYLAVVTDMRLAGTENTDGLDVLRALQNERPDTRFILVTGSGNKEIEHIVLQMGATHYFQKPLEPSLLLTAIKAL